jgi:hypothetical protein
LLHPPLTFSAIAREELPTSSMKMNVHAKPRGTDIYSFKNLDIRAFSLRGRRRAGKPLQAPWNPAF